MTTDTEQKLAASLTAESTELIPFLSYLLQDFTELGSSQTTMVKLLEKYASINETFTVLDLACGKGNVSVAIAEKFNVKVKGVDLLPDFVIAAINLATRHDLAHLCSFAVGDVNEAIKTEQGYDCVIFGAAGNILGNPAEMLIKLKNTIKPGGLILIDEGFLPEDATQEILQYNNYEMLTEKQWHTLFAESGLQLLETENADNQADVADAVTGMANITIRANELIAKHPNKRALFESYIQSQQNEYDDIDNNIICVTWILKKL